MASISSTKTETAHQFNLQALDLFGGKDAVIERIKKCTREFLNQKLGSKSMTATNLAAVEKDLGFERGSMRILLNWDEKNYCNEIFQQLCHHDASISLQAVLGKPKYPDRKSKSAWKNACNNTSVGFASGKVPRDRAVPLGMFLLIRANAELDTYND